MKALPPIPLFFLICLFQVSLCIQLSAADLFAPVPKPQIQWKYGWEDGLKANTIGSAKNGNAVPKTSSYLTTGYSPSEIEQAYGVNLIPTNGTGKGVVLAVVVAYGNTNIQEDLDAFCTKFGIPSTTIQTYYPNGFPSESPINNVNWSGWASETSMDVEWAHAMAPDATIALIVDTDGSGTDQCVDYAVTNLNAKVVSMSFGSTEYRDETSEDSYFQAPGVAYLAAAGDNGGEVDYPSVCSNVISVGGTTMYLSNNIFSEKAWSDGGGGPSLFEPAPPYQSKWNKHRLGRGTPDIAAVADPYTGVAVYFTDPTGVDTNSKSGWIVVGGTSASTPICAGIMARRASLGFSNDKFLPLLYSKQTNSWPCKDITKGNNTHAAATGYDLATGLGSPRADQIVTLNANSTYTNQVQSIIFPPIPDKTYKKSLPFKLAATATSKLPVSFSVISGPATNHGVYGNLLTLFGAGTVVLAADQPGNADYAPAAPVTNSFLVSPASQSISFPSPGTRRYGTNPILLNAKASSGLPVTYAVSYGPASLLGSNTVVTTGVGYVVLSATQPGSSDYAASTNLTTFKIIKGTQKISFPSIPSQVTTNAPFAITLPTSSSGLEVSLSIKGPASLSSNTITLSGMPGTVVLTATQSGDTNYLGATPVNRVFKVNLP